MQGSPEIVLVTDFFKQFYVFLFYKVLKSFNFIIFDEINHNLFVLFGNSVQYSFRPLLNQKEIILLQ